MPSFWTRRSVLVFFALGFGLPWLGWTINALVATEPPLRTVLFYFGDAMTVAGLVATWVAGGTPALRALVGRFFRGGPVGWWVFALVLPLIWQLIPRVAFAAIHGSLSVNWYGLGAFFLPGSWLAFTTGPLGEEFGWRGFFLPRLLQRYRPLAASLILGIIWAGWHYPLYFRTTFGTWAGGLSFTASVLCFAVLLTVLYHKTRGSILLAVLFHWTVNVSPNVAAAMIPGAHGMAEGTSRLCQLASLILVTLVVATLTGWRTLGQPAGGLTLPDEAVEADRLRAGPLPTRSAGAPSRSDPGD